MTVNNDERTTGLTVMLRRLPNPYLPFDPRPSIPDPNNAGSFIPNPTYNPYMTVDYIQNVPIQSNTPPAQKYNSRGKHQPYAAYTLVPVVGGVPQALAGSDASAGSPVSNQIVNPNPPPPTGAVSNNNVIHTFGMQNFPLPSTGYYDWLVHLDRQLISPMELLHVSGYQPYQLTQQFIVTQAGATNDNNTIGNMFLHYVPWLDAYAPPMGTTLAAPWWFNPTMAAGTQTQRLYRLFEFLECGDRATGVDGLSRIPGRVNINTIWDTEILRALVDANTSMGNLTDTQVDAIFTNLLSLRTPGATTLGSTDRPFLPLSTGLVPAGGTQFPNNGLMVTQDTVLRLGPAPGAMGGIQQLMFQNPNDTTSPGAANMPATPTPSYWHPYLQAQLLTKIYNNITVRSNTYAVFLTVGFFQVTNAGTTPPTLGAEIGRSEGRQIRHRMFAIIDRTNLTLGATTYSGAAISVAPSAGPQTVQVTLAATSGTNSYTNAPWSIGIGTTVVFEPGTDNEETVILQQLSGGMAGQMQATFYKNHAAGVTVSVRGNPGPWPKYDPRLDPLVVPYYSIID
jgi:hypothetical protein